MESEGILLWGWWLWLTFHLFQQVSYWHRTSSSFIHWGNKDRGRRFTKAGLLKWLCGKTTTTTNQHLPMQVDTGDAGLTPESGKIPWRRKWQPTLVILPGKSHGQWSLEGYSPQGCRVGHDWAHMKSCYTRKERGTEVKTLLTEYNHRSGFCLSFQQCFPLMAHQHSLEQTK